MNDNKMRRALEFLVISVGIKFLLDSVTIGSINFGKIDALVYAAVLAPCCASHGVREWKSGGSKDDNQS